MPGQPRTSRATTDRHAQGKRNAARGASAAGRHGRSGSRDTLRFVAPDRSPPRIDEETVNSRFSFRCHALEKMGSRKSSIAVGGICKRAGVDRLVRWASAEMRVRRERARAGRRAGGSSYEHVRRSRPGSNSAGRAGTFDAESSGRVAGRTVASATGRLVGVGGGIATRGDQPRIRLATRSNSSWVL